MNSLERTRAKPYALAACIAGAYFKSNYSFTDNLSTGCYAPYPHEYTELNLSGYNCTTIIPKVYLLCETIGLKPEIVQFFDFQNIRTEKDKAGVISPSHFSLIVDVGRKHKYLFDPFYYTFYLLKNKEKIISKSVNAKVVRQYAAPLRKFFIFSPGFCTDDGTSA